MRKNARHLFLVPLFVGDRDAEHLRDGVVSHNRMVDRKLIDVGRHRLLEKTFGFGQRRRKIFDLFARSDEIKHRHALRQRDEKGRIEPEQKVLRDRGFNDADPHEERDYEAQN